MARQSRGQPGDKKTEDEFDRQGMKQLRDARQRANGYGLYRLARKQRCNRQAPSFSENTLKRMKNGNGRRNEVVRKGRGARGKIKKDGPQIFELFCRLKKPKEGAAQMRTTLFLLQTNLKREKIFYLFPIFANNFPPLARSAPGGLRLFP
jgi:hypothetical protein